MDGRFEPYASLLFDKADSLGRIGWEAIAFRAGVADTSRFRACLADPKMNSAVAADIVLGRSIGVTGTPTLVVGDRMLVGAVPADTLEEFLRNPAGAHRQF